MQMHATISYEFEVLHQRGAPREHRSTISIPTWRLIVVVGMIPKYALSFSLSSERGMRQVPRGGA